jgi:hypothetical protein
VVSDGAGIPGGMKSLMATLTDTYLDVGGRNLHVVKSGHGNGTAVILEAGSGCGADIWRAVQELAGEFTTHA